MLMVDAEQLKGLSAEQLHEVTLRLIDGFAEQQRLLQTRLALERRMMQRATARAGAEIETSGPDGDG